jgi:hypothetical protein
MFAEAPEEIWRDYKAGKRLSGEGFPQLQTGWREIEDSPG